MRAKAVNRKLLTFNYFSIVLILVSSVFASCSSSKFKDVSYITNSDQSNVKLNIFVPSKESKHPMPVLIFVHGGNWNTGSKNMYGFIGRNFAKKGIITVIPAYTLSPIANYDQMTREIAAAMLWTKENIHLYNGDGQKLFVTGHSAGGHLVALATLNSKYGIPTETVSGIILNDAAGLDMKHYLQEYPPTDENNYLSTWTNDEDEWKNASPINFLNERSPPFLIYMGKKTYPSIKVANDRFLAELKKYQQNVPTILVDKKHIPMVLQYFWPWNKRYDEIVDFIEGTSAAARQ